ncbi:MAG: DsbA family protein [Marinifilaceae bacterium]
MKLIYVMDPHCGWCFGFEKVILELFEKYKNNPSVSFDIKPGGLFHPAIQINEGFADDKRPIAKRVEDLSGVKFAESYFTNILGNGSFLDSEPPARAILCVKELNKELVVPFTEKLLEKEFIFAKNNSLEKTILETVEEFEIDRTSFEELFHSSEMKQNVIQEFQETRSMVSGYPVLFAKHNGQLIKLAEGYAPFERLVKKIESILHHP